MNQAWKSAAILFCFVHGGMAIGAACMISVYYWRSKVLWHVAMESLSHAMLVFLTLSGFWLYWDVMPPWRVYLAIAAFIMADVGLAAIVFHKLKERKAVSE